MKVDLRHQSPMITVITDASYCPDTKAGGWAAWCVRDGHRLKVSGQLEMLTQNSTEAELLAMLQGIRRALKFYAPPLRTYLLIQSDNTGALKKLGQPGQPGSAYDLAHQHYCKIMEEFSPFLKTRHVKGHSDSRKGARYYVNNWADKEAKKHMREMRMQQRLKYVTPGGHHD